MKEVTLGLKEVREGTKCMLEGLSSRGARKCREPAVSRRPVGSRSSGGRCAWSTEVRGEWTRTFQRAGGGQAMWGLVGHGQDVGLGHSRAGKPLEGTEHDVLYKIEPRGEEIIEGEGQRRETLPISSGTQNKRRGLL